MWYATAISFCNLPGRQVNEPCRTHLPLPTSDEKARYTRRKISRFEKESKLLNKSLSLRKISYKYLFAEDCLSLLLKNVSKPASYATSPVQS